MSRPRLIVIVGPTASGKSRVAVALARQLNGEILSADSMQVYRGMDIGTSKPSLDERCLVPHHGLDLVDPQVEFTVAMYRRYATVVLPAIAARGRVPILVGGTGLYVRALLDGLCQAPSGDPVLRKALAQQSTGALYAELRQVDQVSAQRIHPHDLRRIIRALEVYRLSGRPLSAWQQDTQGVTAEWSVAYLGLDWPREMLYRRIDERLTQMWRQGFVEEARQVHEDGVGRTAAQALGYKELFAVFSGACPLDQAMDTIRLNTHRYAKRQLTWFRQDPRVRWLRVETLEAFEHLPDTMLACIDA